MPEHAVAVVLRPPATWADYYHGHGEMFAAVVDRLRTSLAYVVYLPRVHQQSQLVSALPAQRVLVPAQAIDGPNLLAHADVVISGGGTMIREAAVLGTPAYSIFEGKLGAVDAHLAAEGRLRWIRDSRDVDTIQLQRKPPNNPRPAWPGLVNFVSDAILDAAS